MELTDNQKLIISTLTIQKQIQANIDQYLRVEQVKDYAKSLNIDIPSGIYEKIAIEEMNFLTMLQSQANNGIIEWNSNASDFDNETKMMIYEIEMILMLGEPPYEVTKKMEDAFKKMLNIDTFRNEELLDALVMHMDTTISYIGYWLDSKGIDY